MKEPLISVVIPVYKVENYLERCVNSVINQTYKNLEIILVDDGSPDNCGIICDRYAEVDDRVKVIHKKNGGLSSARNSGIDISSGKYITFIDSDDWVDKEYVEYLYKILIENKCEMAMISHYITSKYDDIRRSKRESLRVVTNEEFLMKLLKVGTQENVQYAWGKLYNNFKKTEIRYQDGLIDEDVPTTFKYVVNCKSVVMSDRKLYFYFNNKDSILRQKFTRKRFDLIEVWKIIVDYANKNCNEQIANYALINLYRANFGVLCNLCTKEVDKNDELYIRKREKQALEVVKQHRQELLKFKIPISRKILIESFCLDYKLAKRMFEILNIRKSL